MACHLVATILLPGTARSRGPPARPACPDVADDSISRASTRRHLRPRNARPLGRERARRQPPTDEFAEDAANPSRAATLTTAMRCRSEQAGRWSLSTAPRLSTRGHRPWPVCRRRRRRPHRSGVSGRRIGGERRRRRPTPTRESRPSASPLKIDAATEPSRSRRTTDWRAGDVHRRDSGTQIGLPIQATWPSALGSGDSHPRLPARVHPVTGRNGRQAPTSPRARPVRRASFGHGHVLGSHVRSWNRHQRGPRGVPMITLCHLSGRVIRYDASAVATWSVAHRHATDLRSFQVVRDGCIAIDPTSPVSGRRPGDPGRPRSALGAPAPRIVMTGRVGCASCPSMHGAPRTEPGGEASARRPARRRPRRQSKQAASDARKTAPPATQRATHDYVIEDRYGRAVLTGTEVKALRMGAPPDRGVDRGRPPR